MAIYFAESYLSRERASELESLPDRLRDAYPVRHLFSCFVADDETAFHVLQASSSDAVRAALERAGLAPDRVVAAAPVCSPRCGPGIGARPTPATAPGRTPSSA